MRRLHFKMLRLIVGTVALTSVGCAPGTYVSVPAFSGRVVDHDARPVPGATVELTHDGDGKRFATIVAGADGRFERAETSHLFLYIAGEDFIQQRCWLTAMDGGHRSQAITLSSGVRVWMIGPPRMKEIGDLRLEK